MDRTDFNPADFDVPFCAETRHGAKVRKATAARDAIRRRRLVDPTTCERDYSAAELEFLGAVEEFQRTSGRMFPTWDEVLEVARGLGHDRASG